MDMIYFLEIDFFLSKISMNRFFTTDHAKICTEHTEIFKLLKKYSYILYFFVPFVNPLCSPW